ncbi:MAG: type II secretion system protein [Kiritimatiellia bacterium]
MKKPTHSTNNSKTSALKSLLVKPWNGFTIIELVIVIGVMSVLLAISLPTVKSVRKAAERRKASIQATLLTQAVIKYKTVYGFWPGQLIKASGYTTDDPQLQLDSTFILMSGEIITPVIISRYGNDSFSVTVTNTEPKYITGNYLYRALNTIDPETKIGPLYQPNPFNPKQIEFLGLDNRTNSDSVGYKDPWGNQFIVFMGLNPASTFTHEIKFDGAPSFYMSVSNTTAFAFSRGPEANESRKYIYSAGVQYHEK